jgi:hypothetical protein
LGGNFLAVSEMEALRIAHWNGRDWAPLGTGVGTPTMGLVHVIRMGDGCFYAGGMFDQLGPWGASNKPRWGNIARHDFATSAWLPLGDGTDRAVRNIAVAPNGDVYCVGEFATAGDVHAQGIARWDGQQWHDVGGSLGARARALALVVTEGGVYVGGFFDSAGGQPISYVAFYDGEKWNPLGSGVNDLVTAMTLHDGKLYVGGMFTQAGGRFASRIAVWDGKNWSALGTGLSGPSLSHVRAIEVDMDQLYVTGTFTRAGDDPVGYITTWDGRGWRPMGSGVNDQTKTAVLHDGVLWVGGNFTQAGGKDICFVAHWTKPGVNRVAFDRVRARRGTGGVTLSWSFTAYRPWREARVARREPGGAWDVLASVGNASDGEFIDPDAAPDRSYDYALIVERETGTEAWSDPVRIDPMPQSMWLGQNRPNPFNPSTSIPFALVSESAVTLRVYDAAGRRVRTLVNGTRPAGEHAANWDGRDDAGRTVATGVYFCRLTTTDGTTLTRRMILVK